MLVWILGGRTPVAFIGELRIGATSRLNNIALAATSVRRQHNRTA